MSESLHEQPKRIKSKPNAVYDRMAELAFEYINKQVPSDISNRAVMCHDLAKLFSQVDCLANPEDGDDGDEDEKVNLADFDFVGNDNKMSDESALLTGKLVAS